MDRSQQDWTHLCQKVKDLIPKEIGEHAWYLIITAALASSPEPGLPAAFYTHLTLHDPSFASEVSQEYLSWRLRDVLQKMVSLVGGPRVLSCLMPLAQAEGDVEPKAQSSKLSEKWRIDKSDPSAIYDRGQKTINSVYGASLLSNVFKSYGSHSKDFEFTEIFTLYGLYLSDFEVLTALETEAVVYSTISCLGLGGPGNWHLRGMGRLLGARGNDGESKKMKKIIDQLENLKHAVVTVVEFVGGDFLSKAKLENWASPEGVMRNMGGWGNDVPLSSV